MNKKVTYQGNIYEIEYNRTVEKGINGRVENILIIKAVNTLLLPSPLPTYTWNNDSLSVIHMVHYIINDYIQKTSIPKTHIQEFKEWNGDLDNWDE